MTTIIHNLLVLTCALSATGESSTIAADDPHPFQNSAGGICSPAVPDAILRPVYFQNSLVHVELTATETDGLPLFDELFEDPSNAGFGVPLPRRQWDRVLGKFALEMDTPYQVYLLDQQKMVEAKLTGISTYFEGGGGRRGFWGIRTFASTDVISKPDRFPNIVGFAIQTDQELAVKTTPLEKCGQTDRDRVEVSLKKHAPDGFKGLLGLWRVPLEGIYWATVRIETSDYLFGFQIENEFLRLLQIREITVGDTSYQYTLPLEDRPAEWDTAMTDSEVQVLPDFDGNGMTQVFVRSRVSYLLDPAMAAMNKPAVVQTIYFGP